MNVKGPSLFQRVENHHCKLIFLCNLLRRWGLAVGKEGGNPQTTKAFKAIARITANVCFAVVTVL